MNFKVKIDEKLAILDALVTKAEDEGRGLNKEEQELYDETEKEVKSLQQAQKRKEELIARKEELRKSVTPIPKVKDSETKVKHDRGVDKPWDSFGENLIAVYNVRHPDGRSEIDPRLMQGMPKNATGAQVAVGSEGGFLVSTQYVSTIMDSIMEDSSVLPRITNIPITSDSNSISIPTLAETSRADGSRWGGIRGYWANEAATVTASQPTFGSLDLKLAKLMALVYATDELLQDASALGSWIMNKLPMELSFKVDDAIINGTGNGYPLGILNGAGLVSVAKETSQVADTVVFENVLKMWARLPPRSRKNADWLINQEVEQQLAQMSLKIKNVAGSENVGGVAVYMPAGGATNAPYSTLFGRPVHVIEQCKTVGDVGDIILTDLSDYIGITKGGVKADVSIHVKFLYDEQVFRFTYRFNGAPYTKSAVQSFANSSHTMSPYVTVAARA